MARPTRSSIFVPSSIAARPARSSALYTAASASISSSPANILTAELPASPLLRLVDDEEESSSSDGNLVPCKKRSVDVSDGVARAVDSVMDDFIIRETATIVLDDDVRLASKVPILAEAVRGVSLPFATT